MSKGVRRIVTGHNSAGKAVVIFDEEAPNIVNPPHRPGVQVNNVWRVFETPAPLAGNADTAEAGDKITLTPPENGAVFRVIEFPPEKDWIDQVDHDAAKASFGHMGAEEAIDSGEKPPHPFMHKTETIDFAVCLSGEIYLVLDTSEVLVKAGDVVVQRGTNHSWSNRSDKACRLGVTLFDGTFAE